MSSRRSATSRPPRACAGSRSSLGAISTIPRRAGRRCTRRASRRSGVEAGIEVTMRTSFAPGRPQVSWRDGYRVIRKAGRYMVFPRAAFSEMMGWHGASDGLVEIWNGMPFFSPLWARRPTRHLAAPRARHDVGDDAAAPARAARARRWSSTSRRRSTAARRSSRCRSRRSASSSSGSDSRRGDVHVVPPGVDARFSPGGAKSPTPARRRGRPAGSREAVPRIARRARHVS